MSDYPTYYGKDHQEAEDVESDMAKLRRRIDTQAARIKELEAVIAAILKKQDDPSMFRLPANCKEVLDARAVLQKRKS